MKHYYLSDDSSGDHYAVGHNNMKEVLVQIQEGGSQARLAITAEQAEHLITLLQENIEKIQS